jgi:hypothetical protein
MSNQEQTSTSPSHRPYLVYTNYGPENDFIPVKQFATRKEAEDWVERQNAELPAYYEVIHQSEFSHE